MSKNNLDKIYLGQTRSCLFELFRQYAEENLAIFRNKKPMAV